MTSQEIAALESLFESIAGLPEVKEDELETGTYTNAQIIEKVPNPIVLTRLIMHLPKSDSEVQRRSILSMAVDMLDS